MKEKSEEHEVGIVDGARTLRRGLEGRGGGHKRSTKEHGS